MSEFNLTIGQAIDLTFAGEIVEFIKDDGIPIAVKFTKNYMGEGFITCFNNGRNRVFYSLSEISHYKFRKYIEPKPVKMVTWYLPIIVLWQNGGKPTSNTFNQFEKSKDKFIGQYAIKEVLEWKEIQAPDMEENE